MGRKVDTSIIGEEFGFLKVIRLADERDKHGNTMWYCLCSLCGSVTKHNRQNLNSCNTSSCGCRKGSNHKVAVKAGVPDTLVSAIMHGRWSTDRKKRCSKEVAERVIRIAKELGYKPWYQERR